MAEFTKALPYVLRHEGGWSDDPDDPGGATNFGITQRTARQHGITTKEALRAITPEQVAAIYRKDYWRFDGFDDQRVATKCLDMAANFGLVGAVSKLQRILVSLGAEDDLVDGRCGHWTTMAVNAVDSDKLLTLLAEACAAHYQGRVKAEPSQAKFLKGWLARAAELPCD